MKRAAIILAAILLLSIAYTGVALAAPVRQAPAPTVSGWVQGSDGHFLSGATITVRMNAMDPANKTGAAVTIGKGTSSFGFFSVRLTRSATIIEVSASKTGYLPITQYGAFKTWVAFTGAARLPLDEGGFPPLPIDW